MEPRTLTELIDRHREELLSRWADLWCYIQRHRPESSFPDPPYEAIVAQLPYSPMGPPIAVAIVQWFAASPVFCTGAAFCQLHVSVATILVRQAYEQRARILRELEDSLEALMLDCGTRHWISTLMTDSSKQDTVRSERLAVIGQLAAGVAHEIGNPLASMSAIVQLMQRKARDAHTTEHLQQLRGSIDRIDRIVHELVDFSRPEAIPPSAVHVHDAIANAVRLLSFDRRSHGVTFEHAHADGLPPVRMVPDQLLQVLINLLINAVDAVDEGGRIRTRTWLDGGHVAVAIEDNGCGIAPDVLPRIFDPFFTTKPVGRGTGLGLSVSYGIVSRYDGRITVHSVPGEGSAFTILLPAMSEQDGAEPAPVMFRYP
jgi:signal transduction histidine kinase